MYPLGMTGAPRDNHPSSAPDVCRFSQLEAWIPHIRSLNFNAIYIGPLFESTSHGYDTRDYRKVDSRLGTNEDFRRFVSLSHRQGNRVVVDAVFRTGVFCLSGYHPEQVGLSLQRLVPGSPF